MRLVTQLGKRCKCVFNSGLYCWKNWFNLFKIDRQFYIDHFDEYLDKFSPNDRLVLGKQFKINGDIEKLHKLIKHSHKSEIELKQLCADDIKQTLEYEQKSIMMDFESLKNKVNGQTIPNTFFNKIKDDNDRERSLVNLQEYKTDIVSTLEHKIETDKVTKEKNKKKRKKLIKKISIKRKKKYKLLSIRLILSLDLPQKRLLLTLMFWESVHLTKKCHHKLHNKP